MRRVASACGTAALVLLALGADIDHTAFADTYPYYPFLAIPVPTQEDARPVPEFIGRAVAPKPITDAATIPQNPFMGSNPWNCGHDDAFMSDTYPLSVPGTLGRNPEVLSSFLGTSKDNPLALSAIIVFDTAGNLIAAPVKLKSATAQPYVQLTLIRSTDLSILATLDLPAETFAGAGFRPAGAYFFGDQRDRTIMGTKDRTVWVVSHSQDAATARWSFNHDDTWDLTEAIPEGDSIQALQPDWSGRVWFTSKGGVVGTLGQDGALLGYTGELRDRGERIVNGHAADDEGGVYIASTQAMYRFDADTVGKPVVTWRETYDAGTHVKEGQTDLGTGTTPTLMGNDYVTISDNGQPRMNVLVYRRAKEVTGPRLVCAEPVFQPGNASNENSLIATDRSIIVENNFGYKDAQRDTTHGRTTKPGIARIDVENGTCRTVWTNESVSIPSLISKLSLASGLIYTYTKPKGPATTDPWYFTAIDFETGAVSFQQLAGTGLLYNNHYAGAYLGPDGTLYVGVLGGIVALRDGSSSSP